VVPRPKRKAAGADPRRTEVSEDKRLLTARQVADWLNVSVRTVWSLRSAGTLKATKVGPKATRFRREDVQKFIDRGVR
jgi:excisionase family DNA binding protein